MASHHKAQSCMHASTWGTYLRYATYNVKADLCAGLLQCFQFPFVSLTLVMCFSGSTQWNKLKMILTGVSDVKYDAWVLLEAGSLTCVNPLYSPPPGSVPSLELEPTRNPTVSPTTRSTSSSSEVRVIITKILKFHRNGISFSTRVLHVGMYQK